MKYPKHSRGFKKAGRMEVVVTSNIITRTQRLIYSPIQLYRWNSNLLISLQNSVDHEVM